MFTLQVLDRGQTFLHPLEPRSLAVGTAADADLRLHEDGVRPRHARIDWVNGGAVLVALAGATVLVNGGEVAQKRLQLGDRIELGRAVLVVGQSVARQATADDVLAESRAAGRARARATGGGNGRSRLLAVVLALLALGGVGWFAFQAQSSTPAPTSQVENLRRVGRFDEARAELARLQGAWAGDDAGRAAVLQAERDLVAAVEAAVTTRKQRLLEEATTATYAELNRTLQDEERSGEGVAQREAARIVRGGLSEFLRQNPVARVGDPAVEEAPPVPAPPVAQGDPEPGREPTPGDSLPTPGSGLGATAELVAEARRLSRDGIHAQALDLLRAAAVATEGTGAALVQQALADVREAALQAMQEILGQASRLESGEGVAAALALLEERSAALPRSSEFAALAERLADLRQRAAVAMAPTRPRPPAVPVAAPAGEALRRATLEGLRVTLEQIRDAEARGDFATVATLARQGAEAVAERDPQFALRLRGKADDFELLAGLVAAAAGTGGSLPAAAGWKDLDGQAIADLWREAKLPPAPSLGLAVLAYRCQSPEVAEQVLAAALQREPGLKERIDAIIARGRGEPGAGGYVLEKGAFTAASTVAARSTAPKVQTRIRQALREDAAARAALVQDLLAEGPQGLETMVLAFQRELRTQVERIDRLPLKKQADKLAEQRANLDAARKFALELIYDEQKYFYPYKPPAVSAEKFAEYNRVQADVDRRTAALRAVWQDDKLKLSVPASLADELDRADWLAAVLRDLGELEPGALAGLDWARSLPPGERVSVQDFCRTPAELAELRQWRRIEAYDRKAMTALSAAEREQFTITNDYRRMFRHRPLALSPRLHKAARGHAQEMGRLGYFSHFSPTEGRKTPYDRMRLEGYNWGASENIALNGSASGAHHAWLHSSGHHRNLLHPSHTEFGIGNDGRHWVQNFGGGTEYEKELPAGR